MISDLEQLLLECRDDEARSLAHEAIKSYQGGAFRSSIVATWVAVVFDLISKIRELSLESNSAAERLERRVSTYITQIHEGNSQGLISALAFEREIIEICQRELGFFDEYEAVELKRIRDDRNRCAHPSFHEVGVAFKPSAELARLHIRNAVTYALSKPPLQGKEVVSKVRSIVSSEFFPIKTTEAAQQLKKFGLENPAEATIRAVSDALCFEFFDSTSDLYRSANVFSALNALQVLFPGVAPERISKNIEKAVQNSNDQQFFFAFALVIMVAGSWERIGEAEQVKVRIYLESIDLEGHADIFSLATGIDDLKPSVQTRIESASEDELKLLTGQPLLHSFMKPPVLQLLRDTRNWDRANTIFSEFVIPLFEVLDRNDVMEVIRMPTDHGTDLHGSFGYKAFIDQVKARGMIDEEELSQALIESGADYLA